MKITEIKYLFVFLVFCADVLDAQWEVIYPAALSKSISGISFANPHKGWYSTTDGLIYQTDNGGLDWKLSIAISPDKFLGIAFADSNCGFAYSPYAYLQDSIGLVYTTDGGRSWSTSAWMGGATLKINTPSRAELFYYKPDMAFASFDDGNIYCSADTFKTWKSSRQDKYYYLSDFGLPYGAISRFRKNSRGELLAVGNSVNAYENKKIADSVAYILKFVDGKNRWDTLWCGLQHPIYDLAFINDSTGWMCGSFGTLLKTGDGGKSWQYIRQSSPYESSFIALRVIDSVTIQIADAAGRVYESSNGGADLAANGAIVAGSDSRFTFISEEMGFLGGRSGLFRTVDNGTTWTKLTGNAYGELHRLDFPDPKTGYAIVDNVLYKTSDGGHSWDKISYLQNVPIRDAAALDSSNVWAVSSGTIYHTTNGGMTWEAKTIDSVTMHKVYFYDQFFGVIYDVTRAGDDYAAAANLVTTDGGATWERYAVPASVHSMNKLFFIDKSTGWFDAQEGIFKTVDGGRSWVNIMPHAPNLWNRGAYSFHFIDPETGWAAYYNLLYKTNDGGSTWTSLSLPSQHETYDIRFLNDKLGCAVGFSGDVMTTTDGGLQWSRDLSLSSRPYRSISVVKEGNDYTVFIGGDGFMILKKDVATSAPMNAGGVPPSAYLLSQNFPNPFNPSTTISFAIPSRSFVSLKIFDVMGRDVSTLVNETLPAGVHARQWNASEVPSGVYFYRLQAGSFVETKRLVLVK